MRAFTTAAAAFFLLTPPFAHAGFFAWCARNLVAPDPYVYETTDLDWLCRHLARLQVRETWGRLTPDDADDLRIARDELRKRKTIASALGQPAPVCR